jgi:hypothetical protein
MGSLAESITGATTSDASTMCERDRIMAMTTQ